MILRIAMTAALVAALALLLRWLVKTLTPAWWRLRPVRWVVWGIPTGALVAGLVWIAGLVSGVGWMFTAGALVTAFFMITLVGLVVVTVPLAGAVFAIHRLLDRRRKERAMTPIDDDRRAVVVHAIAGALPLASVVTASAGLSSAFSATRVYRRSMEFDDLPRPLHGLRILHLTDAHLGIFRYLGHLEQVVDDARSFRPDLVLCTGDLADDLKVLPKALRKIRSLRPRYGVYGCLGNHEYFRGVSRVIAAREQAGVRLLIGNGATIPVQGAQLYVAGADDPRYMGRDVRPFLQRTVDQSLRRSPPGAFKILLSHRPEAFDHAARRGMHLTLAGHTHGGQVGLGGRSFWRVVMPSSYLWGEYRIGCSRMYLSSGIGHWLPLRLGCPAEAPIIELRRTSSSSH